MNIREDMTTDEVQRVCTEIGFRDWTALTEAKATLDESACLKALVGGEALEIFTEDFRDELP